MGHPLLVDAPGETLLLLGNEAIVRGALEAGVEYVTCYPGTPSSEVPDTLHRLSKAEDVPYYFEYSVNEKVALEVAGGAAIAGAMTLTTMKHVGVNVAADPLMTLAYIGTPGGLLLLSADDPGRHSSQNEQDNRYYARLAGAPCFEPATPQEAKDMAREALQLSRRWEQPVMLRTTTRINHLRGPVACGPLSKALEPKPYQTNPARFVPVPANARTRHTVLLENMEIARAEAETSQWNRVSGEGELGVIASGVARAYLRDALFELGAQDKVKVLDLGMSWPLPEKMLAQFLGGCSKALILEELEPILETEVRALAQKLGLGMEITGKSRLLPRTGEYSAGLVKQALAAFLGQAIGPANHCAAPSDLPVRPPNLCAGCSHRALYYAVRQVFGDEAAHSSDIGCYTLGILPPLKCADFLLCMGSSISTGSGMARASGRTTLAFIGDSTFFHSGMTGLVNAMFNDYDLLVVVLDNGITAMTGHQLNPGVDQQVLGQKLVHLDIEAIVRGCGVQEVRTVSPYNVKATVSALEELKALSGVRVLVAREPCVLFARRALRKAQSTVAYVAAQGPDVETCIETLACPAFVRDGAEVVVDEGQCTGCMVCAQIAKGVKARKRSS